MLADLLDLTHPVFWTVEEILKPVACQHLIQQIDQSNPELATINRRDGPEIDTGVRNNERVTVDVAKLAKHLSQRVANRVPSTMARHGAHTETHNAKDELGVVLANVGRGLEPLAQES
jgi:hypothetical protein